MKVIFNYKILEKINNGTSSVIYNSININDPTIEYAIKIIKHNKITNEINILSKLSHPSIIKLYDNFTYKDKLYIVYAKYVNNLDQIIKSTYTNILLDTKIKWINQLLDGLIYLHGLNIIHQDIKPTNIMIDNMNMIKIIDFEMAIYTNTNTNTNIICGSQLYTAPEILLNCRTNNQKTDYWSMGIILYLIIVGRLPFDSRHQIELISKLKNIIDIKIQSNIAEQYDQQLIKLVELMLIVSSKYRINYEQLITHNYIIYNVIYNSKDIELDFNELTYENNSSDNNILSDEYINFPKSPISPISRPIPIPKHNLNLNFNIFTMSNIDQNNMLNIDENRYKKYHSVPNN